MFTEATFRRIALLLLTWVVVVGTVAGQVKSLGALSSDSGTQQRIAVQRASLGPNLDIVFVRDQRFPVVTVHIYIPNVLPLYSGLNEVSPAEVIRHIIGNTLRNTEGNSIGRTLQALGATTSVSSISGSNWIVIRSVCLPRHARRVVRIMSDLLSPDQFRQASVERTINELAQSRQPAADPMRQIRSVMRKHLSLDHAILSSGTSRALVPYSTEVIVESLVSAYGQRLLPKKIVVAVSGRVDFRFVIRLFRNTFRDRLGMRVNDMSLQTQLPISEEDSNTVRCNFIEIRNRLADEVALALGTATVGSLHRDLPALVVLDHVLGSGPGSRLYDRMRIDEGLSYSVSSNLDIFSTHSFFGIFVVFDKALVSSVLTALSDEIGTLLEEGITSDELVDAQRALIGQESLGLESPEVQLRKLIIRGDVLDLSQYWQAYLSSISSVTVDEVLRVARLYLSPKRLVGVVGGNPHGVVLARESVQALGLVDHTCIEYLGVE